MALAKASATAATGSATALSSLERWGGALSLKATLFPAHPVEMASAFEGTVGAPTLSDQKLIRFNFSASQRKVSSMKAISPNSCPASRSASLRSALVAGALLLALAGSSGCASTRAQLGETAWRFSPSAQDSGLGDGRGSDPLGVNMGYGSGPARGGFDAVKYYFVQALR
jgi:hypothetical protein